MYIYIIYTIYIYIYIYIYICICICICIYVYTYYRCIHPDILALRISTLKVVNAHHFLYYLQLIHCSWLTHYKILSCIVAVD